MDDLAVRDLLDEFVPLRPETPPDWDAVLARTGIESVPGAVEPHLNGSGLAQPSRRRRIVLPEAWARRRSRRPLTPVFAAAAVAAGVFAGIAFWPSGGSGGGVVQRALGAIGSDPIIHVVYRDEMHEELVDLKTGRTTPLYEQHEEWFEAGHGLREATTFNGHEIGSATRGPKDLPPQEAQTYAGILDGYRQALSDGTARIAGRDRLAGRDVIWIAFEGQQLLDVGDHRYHDWSHEVAVDASSYRPVYLRETRDGVPSAGTGQEIISLDTLPAGSVDFTPTPPPRPRTMVMGSSNVEDITHELAAGAAGKALGTTALWLGPRYGSLPLAFAQTSDLTSGTINAPEHAVGVELCYGAALPPAALTPAQKPVENCDTTKPHVLIEESTSPASWYQWGRTIDNTIPSGSLLVGWGGIDGFLIRSGVYIHIAATAQTELVAAARALQPLP